MYIYICICIYAYTNTYRTHDMHGNAVDVLHSQACHLTHGPNQCQKRPTIGAKETYYMRTFESMPPHPQYRDPRADPRLPERVPCRQGPRQRAPVKAKETWLEAKETNYRGKRDLLATKETYYRGKRDLL